MITVVFISFLNKTRFKIKFMKSISLNELGVVSRYFNHNNNRNKISTSFLPGVSNPLNGSMYQIFATVS